MIDPPNNCPRCNCPVIIYIHDITKKEKYYKCEACNHEYSFYSYYEDVTRVDI